MERKKDRLGDPFLPLRGNALVVAKAGPAGLAFGFAEVGLCRNAWCRSAGYFAVISATVVSSMRFEKPHSLSYHDETFTRLPDTFVSVASKFDEAGLWL